MNLKHNNEYGFNLCINNLRMNIFPETIRAIKDLYEIFEEE